MKTTNKGTKKILENQAKKIKSLLNSKLPSSSTGDWMRVKIPDVDFKNVITPVVEITYNKSLGTREKLLRKSFPEINFVCVMRNL